MSHWTGTLDLVRTTLEDMTAWQTACGGAIAAPKHIVTGIGGHPWDGTFLIAAGTAQALALPIAQIALGEPLWQPVGVKRWERDGEATVDVAMTGACTPAGYAAAVQLAEDLLDGYRAASDAGTLLLTQLRVTGTPLRLPQNIAAPFAGAWVFQLTLNWEMNRQ